MNPLYVWLRIKHLGMLSAFCTLLLVVGACTAPVAPVEPAESNTTTDSTENSAGEEADPFAPVEASAEQVVIRVGTGDSGEGLAPHQEIIRRFEEANPDVKVQLEPVSGNDYYARLLTQIAAGDAPDIMNIGDDAVPRFVESDAFIPLQSFIDDSNFDTSVYLSGLLDPGTLDGELYFLPKDYSPLAVYYNERIFDENGVDYPEDGWTWDDFLATAQALTIDDNGDGTPETWGIQLPGPWTTGFEYWVAAAGGQLISDDGSTYLGYMDSEEVISAVEFYQSLYTEFGVAPPPADMSAFGGGNAEFDNGQAAMRIFGRWPQSGMMENPNIDLGVVGVPAGAERANVLFWGGFGIFSGTEHPDEAWRFLQFYAGPDGAEVWKDWALPAVTSVAEESGVMTDSINGVWIKELDHLAPRAYMSTPYWGSSADPALRSALEAAILDPEADVAALMSQAATIAQDELEFSLE